MRTTFASILLPALLAGCMSTQVISTDLTRQSGVYVVGYVEREDIRAKVEDRFVTDLGRHEIRAVASRNDIGAIKQATPDDIVRAANEHAVVAILVVNRVSAAGDDSVIDSGRRIGPEDPDLKAYFDATRAEIDSYGADDPVFAEVNAFFVDGSKTRRFWTGTSWTFQEDEDQVIDTISKTIAEEVARAARELRDYGRPIQ